MKKLYLSLSLLAVCFAGAQEVQWQKNIPSDTQDFLSNMTSTVDRQILLSGSSINTKAQQLSTGSLQNNGYDYHVLKLDQQGNKLWDKYFGGSKHDYLMSSIATQEGGFALVGTSFSNISGDKKENNLGGSDVWIVRLSETGEELWQKTLGTKSNDEASSVVQSTDMGFFVAGNINDNRKLFGSKDIFVSKLGRDGKLIKTTILGGKSLDEVTDMIPTADGGIVVLIYSTSGKAENLNNSETQNSAQDNNFQNETSRPELTSTVKTFIGKSEDGFGAGDYWIIKLDKNANVEWQKTYGGTGDDRPKSIANTENGYIVSGESTSQSSGNKKENIKEGTDLWVLNLDRSGNELWQKNYSFGNRDVVMSLDVIRKTNKDNFSEDKGFLLGGYTQAEEKVKSDDEKFWMLYIDTNGKEEWRKYVEGKEKKNEERLVSARLQSDGSYLLAGTSADQLGEENWKIVKLGDKQVEDLIERKDLQIYPNPAKDFCYVELDSEFKDQGSREVKITVYDMTGKVIQQLTTKNKVTKINTSGLPQGIYIIKASTADKSLTTKLIKE
ncbi:T9SS type A sorting domain-containing protein [Chryseobacterium sp. SC28]|uniref:T9SS type A sorting domain-containing protein n=1 Tax=Chryseobacterium sp. SC28 TaxID=2268028 RepID=UPI000F64F2E9|nr:T9SS type A sorting domain-containing protein [Chryseobacterium sp. SC28]RRQ46500.1 T9SS C-terminal target domain-containing protein [Chryseobacterium sp. SC28]